MTIAIALRLGEEGERGLVLLLWLDNMLHLS